MNGRIFNATKGRLARSLAFLLCLVLALSLAGGLGIQTVQANGELEFGDAPDPFYPSLLVSDGVRHLPSETEILGLAVSSGDSKDYEPDANVPDLDLLDDGLLTMAIMANNPAETITFEMTDFIAPSDLFVNILIDLNRDGTWQGPREWVVQNMPIHTTWFGTEERTVVSPPFDTTGALPGLTYLRITLTRIPISPPLGDWDGTMMGTGTGLEWFDCGETEDWEILIEGELPEELDFGDAPDPGYPTLLASNGACHVPGTIWMGPAIDVEPDGQPNPTATGDDISYLDDEDGVALLGSSPISGGPFSLPYVAGQYGAVRIEISSSAPDPSGYLHGWFDWNQDGDWDDPGENVFCSYYVHAVGLYDIQFDVPADAMSGSTYARFRLDSYGVNSVRGLAEDGEVEDYLTPELDFGDAPDPTYPTLLASNGARHVIVSGFHLGPSIDSELDGQPDPTATGDDLSYLPDEDGVTFPTLAIGQFTYITVNASQAGQLDAWFDWNHDGDWDDTYEHPLINWDLHSGDNNDVPLAVPGASDGVLPGDTFCRFRFSSVGGLPYDGHAYDGEVEDYMVKVFIAINGKTGEVNCDDLGDVTLDLFDSGGTPVDSTTSDGGGNYSLYAEDSVTYSVVASKTGFHDRTQDVTVAGDPVTLDFVGETGLIPLAASMSYVLTCVNHWLYPVGNCGLTMSTVLAVVNAWLYPQPGPR